MPPSAYQRTAEEEPPIELAHSPIGGFVEHVGGGLNNQQPSETLLGIRYSHRNTMLLLF